MGVNVSTSVSNIYLNVLNILHNVKNLNSPTFFPQKISILFILRRIFLWDSHSYELWQHFVTMPEWKQEMLSTFESNFLIHYLQTSHFKSNHSVRFITVVSKEKTQTPASLTRDAQMKEGTKSMTSYLSLTLVFTL